MENEMSETSLTGDYSEQQDEELEILQEQNNDDFEIVNFPVMRFIPMMLNAGTGTKTHPRHFEPVKQDIPYHQFLRCSLRLKKQDIGKESFWILQREKTQFFD